MPEGPGTTPWNPVEEAPPPDRVVAQQGTIATVPLVRMTEQEVRAALAGRRLLLLSPDMSAYMLVVEAADA